MQQRTLGRCVVAATCLVAAGCGPGAARRGLHLWAVGESQRVFADSVPEDETDCFSRRDGRLQLSGAINEVVGCQVVLTAGAERLDGLELKVEDLVSGQHRLGSERVTLYRQWFVPVANYPTWYLLHSQEPVEARDFPDILTPLQPGLSVAAGRSQPIWMDVSIPLGTEPGLYRSQLRVLANRRPIGQMAIELEVWPFALPSQPHLPLLVGVDVPRLLERHLQRDGRGYVPVRLSPAEPMRQPAMQVIDAAMQLLHEHRCSGYLWGYWPAARQGDAGEAVVDWADYDDLVRPYITGQAFADRTRAAAWPIPMGVGFPEPDKYGGSDAPGYWRFLEAYITACARHFAQQGWLERALAWYDLPAPNEPGDYRRFRQFAEAAAAAEPTVPLAGSLLPQSMVAFGWPGCYYEDLSPIVDIWVPPGRFYDPDRMRQLQQAGARAWLRVDEPPFAGSVAIAAPLPIVRAIPWQAMRCGADGVLIDHAADWPRDLDLAHPRPREPGHEDWLLWPGPLVGLDRPAASIRLKQLRRGMQDYEYLWLLRQHGRQELADLVAGCLVKYAGTRAYADNYRDGRRHSVTLEPPLWSLARRLMGQELARAMGGGLPEPIERFAERLEWRRLLTATRKIRVWVDGVRVGPAPDKAPGWQVQVFVTVCNELAQAVEGTLGFDALPAGWTATNRAVPIGPISPLDAVRTSVTAHANDVATDQYGLAGLTVVFDAGLAGLATARGRVAAISVPQAKADIVVDGDPSDWPVGWNNTAGDFWLFNGSEAAKEPGAAAGRATQQTLAFVLRDGRNLYFLVHCLEQRMDQLGAEQSNMVRYDGLAPAGEDVVEILLDPAGAATGASGDLYHILVKHNGVVISERGVGVDPPIGAHGAWAARARACVRDLPDRWIVEMAIPLSAFDAPALAEPAWGLNISRLQPRFGEYSSWSAAGRHMYNSQSLGTVIWLGAGRAGP